MHFKEPSWSGEPRKEAEATETRRAVRCSRRRGTAAGQGRCHASKTSPCIRGPHPWAPFRRSETAAKASNSFAACGRRSTSFAIRRPLKTILVSSGMPAEGKTFVAANLAMSLARNKNNKVLLIDADLRRPVLHTILGAPNAPGLTEYLAGGAEVSDILQRNQNSRIVEAGRVRNIPNLTFIPAGAGGDNLLGTGRQSPHRRADSNSFTALRLDPDRLAAGSRVCGRNRPGPRRRCGAAGCPRAQPLLSMSRSARRPPSAARAFLALC